MPINSSGQLLNSPAARHTTLARDIHDLSLLSKIYMHDCLIYVGNFTKICNTNNAVTNKLENCRDVLFQNASFVTNDSNASIEMSPKPNTMVLRCPIIIETSILSNYFTNSKVPSKSDAKP